MKTYISRWLRGQRIFICPECGKRWPRTVIFEICGGTHLAPHPHRLMVRTRTMYRRDNSVEMAAEAMRFDR